MRAVYMSGVTEERNQVLQSRVVRRSTMTLERKIAYYMLGVTFTIFAYLLYGAQNVAPKLMRNTSPRHILHHDYVSSGDLPLPSS